MSAQRSVSREQGYLEKRWLRQYAYYSTAAQHNKIWNQRLTLFIVIASVAIPVLINMDIPNIFVNPVENVPMPTIVPTLLGLAVAIATGVENVKKYGDNWRNYRQAVEALKRERAMYDTRTGEYAKSEDPFSLFVQRSEQVMGEEISRFSQIHQPDERLLSNVPQEFTR